MKNISIQAGTLHISEIASGDLLLIHALHSLPETARYNTLGIPQNVDETQQLLEVWIKSQTEDPRKKYVLAIRNETNEFIGLIGINIGKPDYRNAEIWYKIHPTHWNKGHATTAVKSILEFCFINLKLHRVEAGCATANIASIKVLEKAGMIREGSARKLLPIEGNWADNYAYAILEEDFAAQPNFKGTPTINGIL